MERKIINPWQWQDRFGFVQANDVRGCERIVWCAGQTAMDADGRPVHAKDMRAQISYILDNLEIVLAQSSLGLSHVMRLNYYTTDVDAFMEAYPVLLDRLKQANCRPASTLLGVKRLAFPELLVEMEATVVV